MKIVPDFPVAARRVHDVCELGTLEDLLAADILAPKESAEMNMKYARGRHIARERSTGGVERDQVNTVKGPFVCAICWKLVQPTERIALIPISGC